MRSDERVQDGMFSYVSLEQRVPEDHPLRSVRKLTDGVLRSLDALYAGSGRPSIAPEYILRALLLQVFFSMRSERLLVEQIDYNLLFRWFVGLGMDDVVWNHAVFSKNRDRLRIDRRGDGDHGRRHGRARCGAADAPQEAEASHAAHHRRC